MPYLEGCYGNPSSVHQFGRKARAALDQAREQVAALVNVHPAQVVFTGGGTEANNLAIQGLAAGKSAGHLLVGATEHASVLEPAAALQRRGWQVEQMAVSAQGLVDVEEIAQQLTTQTRLLSLMLANNETGVIQDLAAVSEVVRSTPAILHCDAVQALGKLAVDFDATGAHLMSLSAHKIYGPMGVGALIMAPGLELEPILYGGQQERGLRSGSENIAGIVGFGKAAELAHMELTQRQTTMLTLRSNLERRLTCLNGVVVFAQHVARLPNTVYFAVPGIEGEALVMMLDEFDFAVASGSACSSQVPGSNDASGASHVLLAMGVAEDLARSAIRVSFGANNTATEVEQFVLMLEQQIAAMKGMAVMAI